MVIKKHKTVQPQTTAFKKRLEAYAQQGRSYRKTHRGKTPGSNSLLKATLAAMIPLAAAGALQAQTGCQGQVNGGANITLNFNYNTTTGSIDKTVITVGGQNMSFSAIRYDGGPYPGYRIFKVAGANFQFAVNGSLVSNFNGTVTRSNENSANYGKLCSVYFPSSATTPTNTSGNFCSPLTGHIALKQTNVSPHRPGWVQIQIVSFNTNQVQFKILERGVEDPANTPNNSAHTNLATTPLNCATINAPALPVEMTHFRATPQGGHIQLEWATASEINNDGFEVQRSTDGRSFAKVGWVDGRGTADDEQAYQFIDDEVQPNTNYFYRLQQMDADGTSAFSPVRSAMVEDADIIQVSELFPNPVGKGRASARFKLNVPEEGEVNLQVFDSRGGLVKALKKNFPTGSSILSVPVSDLAAGQYFVKLLLGQEVVYRKLVVR